MTQPAPTPTVRKLGPGILKVGTTGSLLLDFSARCTSATVVPDKDKDDDTLVLSGATIAGETNYTAALTATVFQDDLVTGGLIRYSWENKGVQVPFTFTPYNNQLSVTGTLTVDPLPIGGEVGKKNTTELEWDCVGFPTIVTSA